MYVTAMIFNQVLPAIVAAGPYLTVVVIALGNILLLVSLQLLCLSLCRTRSATEAKKS